MLSSCDQPKQRLKVFLKLATNPTKGCNSMEPVTKGWNSMCPSLPLGIGLFLLVGCCSKKKKKQLVPWLDLVNEPGKKRRKKKEHLLIKDGSKIKRSEMLRDQNWQ